MKHVLGINTFQQALPGQPAQHTPSHPGLDLFDFLLGEFKRFEELQRLSVLGKHPVGRQNMEVWMLVECVSKPLRKRHSPEPRCTRSAGTASPQDTLNLTQKDRQHPRRHFILLTTKIFACRKDFQ